MKSISTLFKNALIFCLTLFFCSISNAQFLVEEISFDQQVDRAQKIVEGIVTDQKSYWTDDYSHIYTVNIIEVHKVFKGNSTKKVQLVTWGGTINDITEIVNPSLTLHKNDVGIFFIESKDLKLVNSPFQGNYYRTHASVQGFFKYNIAKDKAVNAFKEFNGIEQNFYKSITERTNHQIIQLDDYNVGEEISRVRESSSTLDIISISPTTAPAGTEAVLTITGDNFLPVTGRVSFAFGNDGGRSFVDAFDDQILSWTDDEILVQIPSAAGTGEVKVTTTTGTEFLSDVLTIPYSHLTDKDNQNNPTEEYLINMIEQDNNGGIDWTYNNQFENNAPARDSFRRAFDNWVCNTGVNWKINGSTTARGSVAFDQVNLISFDVNGDLGDSTLGAAFSFIIACDNSGETRSYQADVDILFDPGRNWNFGPDPSTGSEIDFETVALHEMGHAQLLAHIIDPDAVMHFALRNSVDLRVLEPNDITGGTAIVNRSKDDPICGRDPIVLSACSLSTDDIIADSISVYPNPATSEINIKTQSSLVLKNLELIDVRGRLILAQSFDNNENINSFDVSDFSKGVYLLKLESNQGTVTKKIILE